MDHEGIHYGKKSLQWSEVGTVGPSHGPRIFRVLPITPANRWAPQLTLTQDNIDDVPAFAAWLDALLAERDPEGSGAVERPSEQSL